MAEKHIPVLLDAALDGLAIRPDGVYMDLTFGRGGHSAAVLSRLGSSGRLIALDKDPAAIAQSKQGPFCDPRFIAQHRSFAELAQCADELGVAGRVNGILMDLGVSSPQLDDPSRGFSFTREGPLDMRMNPASGCDAASWLAVTEEQDIQHVLKVYGEERYARRIARKIVMARAEKAIETTTQLADLISDAVPRREPGKHPATRSFQAIRIAINHELEDLQQALDQCLSVLAAGGRLVVIAFHSLEDRIVKTFFQQEAQGKDFPLGLPVQESQIQRRLRIVTRLLKPSAEEIQQNVRARSARLRIAEKII